MSVPDAELHSGASPSAPEAVDELGACQLVASFRTSREPWTWYARRRLRWWLWRARRPYWKLKAALKRRVLVCVGRTPEPLICRPPVHRRSAADVRAGDRVRVRPFEEIRQTLDEKNKCHGCAFLAPMRQFCGREFRVAKRVHRFFDENRWRMLKSRNTVLLEGVYCDGSFGHPDTRGCDRLCFLFWRTEWLERVDASRVSRAPSSPTGQAEC
jgi:hypothetical protein